MQNTLTSEQIDQLKSFDTCVISDAIESFGVRLRNQGFATADFRCLFKSFPPMVGYATTCKIRSADPPIVGSRYIERTDLWRHIESIGAPRVVVVQDIDEKPGTGAFIGRVHANIFLSMGCVGAVTNGAARELPGIEASGFQIFAGSISMSRAYVHVVGFGIPVELGGLTIRPGDLIHGDRHGIITIPPELASALPGVAHDILEKKTKVINTARKSGRTIEELSRGLREIADIKSDLHRNGAKTWEQ
jgi:4-hydroxy-4-methyl-2-oxoglutarate aldolase